MALYGRETESIKDKLSKLHCPFTWDIADSVVKYTAYKNKEDNTDDYEASCDLELLMIYLLECYKNIFIADNNATTIEKAEEILRKLQQDQQIHQTIRAMEHVFYATKCHILYKRDETDELKKNLEKLIDIKGFNDKELGALYGCQSVVWSCLHDFGVNEAINIAKKAIQKHQDFALWHYILAKNLRRQRRSFQLPMEVTDLEKKHSEMAYNISKNPIYGVYYLQIRLESFYIFKRDRDYRTRKIINEKEVVQLAKKMLQTKPDTCKVLLKLALIFLRARFSNEVLSAKECLNAVEKIAPNDPTYLHYLGLFHEECKDYKEAVKYFKKAAIDHNNFAAEFSYMKCGVKTGELEVLPHLLKILERYQQLSKENRIKILLAIAVTYYESDKYLQSAEYFVKALQIDSGNKCLKVYYKFLDFETKSITDFLNHSFLRISERDRNPALHKICCEIKELLTPKDINNLTKEFKSSLLK